MAATVEKMNTDIPQGKPKKGRKTSNATKKGDPSVSSPSVISLEAEKENRGVPVVALTPKGKKNNKETLKNVSNIVPTPPTLEEELQAVRVRLEKLNMEKEKTEKILEERDAMLKEKEAELELKGKAQEKLQMELRRLQKLKEFKPLISVPLEQPLRMGELAKEKEKKKKKSDPNKPKKPSAPYMLWVQDQWNQVKSENPNIPFKDMGAILGAKWKSLSAEEKKPYEEKYEVDKGAYQQVVGQEKRQSEAFKLLHEEQKQKTALDLLEQYLQYKKDAEVDEKGKRKKEKDPSKPKQPLTAFFAFCNERRAALLPEKKNNVLEISKVLGIEWTNMTKEQRAPYEKIAAEAKEQYMHEMELYKQKKDEEASAISKEEEEKRKIEKEEALRLLRKKEKEEKLKKTINVQLQQKRQQREKNTDPDKPKKPPTSFLLFSKAARKKIAEERPGIDNKTISALISVKWKELEDVEKQVWEDQAAKAMVQYKIEMEEYKKEKEQTQNGILSNPEEMEAVNSSITITTTS